MASKPKACKFTEEMKTTVDKLLANDYSPEQIAGRCKLEGRPYVSYECIYQYIWEDKMRKGQLYLYICDIMGVNTENEALPKIRAVKYATK